MNPSSTLIFKQSNLALQITTNSKVTIDSSTWPRTQVYTHKSTHASTHTHTDTQFSFIYLFSGSREITHMLIIYKIEKRAVDVVSEKIGQIIYCTNFKEAVFKVRLKGSGVVLHFRTLLKIHRLWFSRLNSFSTVWNYVKIIFPFNNDEFNEGN